MSKKQLIINIASIYASILLSSIPFGIISVLIAIKMNHYVQNETLIALASATQLCSGIVFSKYLPKMARKFGITKTIYISTIAAAILSILMYQYFGYFVWLITIFIFGTALFTFSIIRSTITLDISPPSHKAIIVSTGGMLMSLGNASGPIILNFIGNEGITPYIIAAALYFTSMLPMIFIKNITNFVREDKKIGILRYIKISPKIMFGGFVFNYIQSSASTFLIIYGIKSGMQVTQASLMLSVLLFGTIFSIPIGYFTDIVNRRLLMLISTIITFTCALSMFFVTNIDVIYVLLFLMFGFMIGIKLPALILINEKYKPTQRLAVNSAFSKMCLIGNVCGIFTTGAIMELYGPHGLWISIVGILSLYLLLITSKIIFLRHGLIINNYKIIKNA